MVNMKFIEGKARVDGHTVYRLARVQQLLTPTSTEDESTRARWFFATSQSTRVHHSPPGLDIKARPSSTSYTIAKRSNQEQAIPKRATYH